MNDRYRNQSERQSGEGGWGRPTRQDEQFRDDSQRGQQGEQSWRDQQSNRSSGDRWAQEAREYDPTQSDYAQRGDYSQSGGNAGGGSSAYDRQRGSSQGGGYGRQGYGPSGGGSQGYSQGGYGSHGGGYENQGRYRSEGGNYGAGRYGSGNAGGSYGRGAPLIPERQYDRDDRGLFERASDEVMSWFGDDDAARRRKMDSREDHSGRGPSGYIRSSERLIEDANERLTRDPYIDARNIKVSCQDNEMTLEGTVDSRSAKRRAEDIVEDISGLKHVQNNLRVETRESYYARSGTASYGATGSSSPAADETSTSGTSKTQA